MRQAEREREDGRRGEVGYVNAADGVDGNEG